MIILALNGNAKSGKDYLAKRIISTLPEYKIARFAFADTLKEQYFIETGFRYSDKRRADFCAFALRKGSTTRELCNEIKRSGVEIAIITDMRFPLQYFSLHTLADVFIPIYIHRFGYRPANDLDDYLIINRFRMMKFENDELCVPNLVEVIKFALECRSRAEQRQIESCQTERSAGQIESCQPERSVGQIESCGDKKKILIYGVRM